MKSSFCFRLEKRGQALKILQNAFQDCSDLNCSFETQELFPRSLDGSLTSFHTEVEGVQWTLVFLYILHWSSRMLKTGISWNTNRRLM